MSSTKQKNASSLSSSDEDKDPEFRPSHQPTIPPTTRHLRMNRNVIYNESRSLSGDLSNESTLEQSNDNNENIEASIINISDDEDDIFNSFEAEDDDDEINPFCIFPIVEIITKIVKMAHNNSPSLSFISSMAKLGETREGKPTNNWTAWSENLRSFLMLQDLWVPIDTPLGVMNENDNAKCVKAFHVINLTVADNVKSLIRNLNHSVAAWVALKDYYNKPTVVNKVAIVRKIVSEKLQHADDLENHILRMKSHFQSLEDLGEKWSQSMNIAFLLQTCRRNLIHWSQASEHSKRGMCRWNELFRH